MRPLFAHQESAVAMLRASLAGGKRRPMVQAPTGFGKTMLGAAIVEGALRKGKRVLFTVPALSLVDQTVESFWNEGIADVGVIQGLHDMTNAARPVQVASVQTLMRRDIPRADIVIIDEAHRWYDFYGQWMARDDWRNIPFIGLSATPWTKGLGKHFDDLLIAATTGDLIRAGYLSPFRVFAPSHPDLKGVRTVAGDWHEGDLSTAMDKPTLVADLVDTWRRMADNRPTLVFGVDCAHATNIWKQFQAAGIPAAYIDADTGRDERDEIRKAFHAGSIKVVCNIGTLTTGVDWDVRCIVLARPTKSEMLFTQIIGRGLRTAEGKQDCLILDHSDTHLRLGFVTDICHDHLDDGKPRQKAETREQEDALPKECPKCSFLKPPKLGECPACGFKPERQSDIRCEEGELVELQPKKQKFDAATKARWLAELAYIGRSRGYRDGWAAQQYRSKFGVWPAHKAAQVLTPSADVLGFVKSRQIAYANRRAAA